MASSGLNGQTSNLSFYPAYCFTASPTYFVWVKLTAFDIHNTLCTRRGFEGQNLYFYLNHPIQFIYVVGVVVSYEDFHEKRWLLIIDDSSGSTIEATCPKPGKITQDAGREEKSDKQNGPENRQDTEQQVRAKILNSVDVGSVIKARGRVVTFRDVRQIQLEQIEVVPDTNAEVHFWAQRVKFQLEVLSKPWSLTSQEQVRLREAARGEDETKRAHILKSREREAALLAREERHAENIARHYEGEEVRRKEAAEAARQAGRMLVRTNSSQVNGTPEAEVCGTGISKMPG